MLTILSSFKAQKEATARNVGSIYKPTQVQGQVTGIRQLFTYTCKNVFGQLHSVGVIKCTQTQQGTFLIRWQGLSEQLHHNSSHTKDRAHTVQKVTVSTAEVPRLPGMSSKCQHGTEVSGES